MTYSVQQLFDHAVHIGHRAEKWNPKMKRYLIGKSGSVWLFDLEKTAEALEKTVSFLKAIKLQNKKVLFVGTKPQSALAIERLVKGKKHFFVDRKWTPGLLTNFKELRKRIDHFLTLQKQFETGEINKYTKKEVAKFRKDLDKLTLAYGGVAEMRQKPDVMVVLDAVVDDLAIEEAHKAGVAVVAIVDANANPDFVDYVIPANDDAIRSVEFILKELLGALE